MQVRPSAQCSIVFIIVNCLYGPVGLRSGKSARSRFDEAPVSACHRDGTATDVARFGSFDIVRRWITPIMVGTAAAPFVEHVQKGQVVVAEREVEEGEVFAHSL